jgi:hypothetical protein
MALNLQNLPTQNNNPLQHVPTAVPRANKGWKHSLFKLIGATVTGIMVFSMYNMYITLNPANFGDRSGPSNLKASLNTIIEDPTPTITASTSSQTEGITLDDIITTDSTSTEEVSISSSSDNTSSSISSTNTIASIEVPDTVNIQNIGSTNSATNTSVNPIYLNIRVDKPEISSGEALLIQSYPPVESGLPISFHISHASDSFTPLKLNAITDTNGYAIKKIQTGLLKKSGEYAITITTGSGQYLSKSSTTINVVPGKLSSTNSSLTIVGGIDSFTAGETIDLEVSVRDGYDNPITRTPLTLISSTPIAISPNTLRTNSFGKAQFTVTNTAGRSEKQIVFQVFEGSTGTTFGYITIENIPSISWLQSLFPIAHAQSAESISIFGLPAKTDPGDPITFDIEILDAEGEVYTDFEGSLTFEVTDSEAETPNDYTFSSIDQGENTWLNELTLYTPGEHVLTVSDPDTPELTASASITVNGDAGSSDDNTNTSVAIISPLTGTILDSNIIDIAGQTSANSEVEVFDGSNSLGKASADSDGLFFFTTSPLADGERTLIAKSGSSESTPVIIQIDTNSPEVDSIEIAPDSPISGQEIQIKVQSEANLKKAKFISDNRTIDLIESATPGVYEGKFLAPSTPGDYSVQLELADDLSNPALYKNVRTYTVRADGGGISTGTITPTITTGNTTTTTPSITPTTPVTTTEIPTTIPTQTNTGPKEILASLLLFALGFMLYWEIASLPKEN